MLTIARLSLAEAHALIAGARDEAERIAVPMCIAVSDESGHLIAFERMDGGKALSTQLAQDKAMSAAVSRKPTHQYNAECVPGRLTFGIHTALGGRFNVMGGGLPVAAGEDVQQVVGGIGVSGGTPEQDVACAEAGLAGFRQGA